MLRPEQAPATAGTRRRALRAPPRMCTCAGRAEQPSAASEPATVDRVRLDEAAVDRAASHPWPRPAARCRSAVTSFGSGHCPLPLDIGARNTARTVSGAEPTDDLKGAALLTSLYQSLLLAEGLTPRQLAGICDYAESTGDTDLLAQLARYPHLDPATDARLARRPEAAVRVAWISRPGRDAETVREVLGQEGRISILAAVAALTTIDEVLRSQLSAIGHPRVAEALLRTGCATHPVQVAAYRTLAAATTLPAATAQLLIEALADGEILASVAGVASSRFAEWVLNALANQDLRLAENVYQHLFDVICSSVDLRAKAASPAGRDQSQGVTYREVAAVQMLRNLAALPGAPQPVAVKVQETIDELCQLAGLESESGCDQQKVGPLAEALLEARSDLAAIAPAWEAARSRDPRRLDVIAADAINTNNPYAVAAVLLNRNAEASTIGALWSTRSSLRRRARAAAVARAHRARPDTLLTLMDLSGPADLREILGAVDHPKRLTGQYLDLLAACGPDIVSIKREHLNTLLELPLVTADLLRSFPARVVAEFRPSPARQPAFGAALAVVLQPVIETPQVAAVLAALAVSFDGRLGDLVTAAQAATV